MQLLKKILKKLDGLVFSQEYLCTGKESFTNPLHVYVIKDGRAVKDITNLHCFTGYSPLIIAMDPVNLYDDSDEIEIGFSSETALAGKQLTRSALAGSILLKKICRLENIDFFEGRHGTHRFLNGFHQWIGRKFNDRYNHKPGNVFLHNDLYSQVQLAYAVPRKISLITVEHNGYYNLFPTDLHGEINNGQYILSLRHEGFAARQVGQSGRVLLCDVRADMYKQVYALGKNHMQPLKPAHDHNFSTIHSTQFSLPLPQGVIRYKELKVRSSFDHGIHRLFVCDIVNREENLQNGETLVHIHNVYATWRLKNGVQTHYLMR